MVLIIMPGRGLEPLQDTPHGPQPCASTNSATPAYVLKYILSKKISQE